MSSLQPALIPPHPMTEILSYQFFQNALLGALLASVLCAVVGTYVVTRRMVIAGGGMAHASLGGVGMGAYFGFPPLAGAAAVAVASGFAIQWLSGRRQVREDSAVAMLWTLGMALGILFAYMAPGFMTDLPSYLFGDILSISRADLAVLGALTVVAVMLHASLRRTIMSVASDRDFARTQGLPVRAVESAMTVLTALTIVGCLHMVGIVMVVSLLSVPQATAALWARTYGRMVWLSAVLAYAGCLGGLALSYWADVPGGAAIIVVSIGIYALGRAIKALKKKISLKEPSQNNDSITN